MKNAPSSGPKKATPTRPAKTPTVPTKQSDNGRYSSCDEVVAEKAYYMYLNQGSQSGLDIHHWMKAEAEVKAHQVDRIATLEAEILNS